VRLLFFTPALRASAVARASTLIVRALLRQRHQVTVVRTEDTSYLSMPTRVFDVELVRWDDRARVDQEMRSSDSVIHQIGNSYEFHRGNLDWLAASGGVVCLHDFFLGHLFWGWSEARRDRAANILRAWYGAGVAAGYFAFSDPGGFIDSTHREAPMVEWIASMADGVATHSSWGVDRVLASCGGPVDVMPLPYDAPNAVPADMADAPAHADRFMLLTIGHINPNKRVDTVISAIASSRLLRERCHYQLVGRVEPETSRNLAALAASLRVSLELTGEVDDERLALAMRRADVLCCLRLPALEAASASAIEAMLYGKAVVVLDTAFYRELPDDCVCKVAPESGTAGVRRALERFAQQRDQGRALGARARNWAAATFSADAYAEGLVALCERAVRSAPALRAARTSAESLLAWGASDRERTNRLTLDPLQILEESLARR
jgi:glycosyltransferase involved in cell wall biosynthesis